MCKNFWPTLSLLLSFVCFVIAWFIDATITHYHLRCLVLVLGYIVNSLCTIDVTVCQTLNRRKILGLITGPMLAFILSEVVMVVFTLSTIDAEQVSGSSRQIATCLWMGAYIINVISVIIRVWKMRKTEETSRVVSHNTIFSHSNTYSRSVSTNDTDAYITVEEN